MNDQAELDLIGENDRDRLQTEDKSMTEDDLSRDHTQTKMLQLTEQSERVEGGIDTISSNFSRYSKRISNKSRREQAKEELEEIKRVDSNLDGV